MLENITTDRPNFCIGPQAGSYCTVDNEASPVVMHALSSNGTIIRTYTFYPQDVLHTGPENEGAYEVLPNPSTYTYHDFVTIQYVGPYNQASFYDGAIFFTLERRALGKRKYYTYDDPNDPEKASFRVEYDSNIVRKWVLDQTNFRLVLDRTYYFNSDEDYWFGSSAFVVQHTLTSFDWSTPAGTGVIEVTTTSGLKKYDTLFLGPSTDTSNPGEVEEVYVHSVNGTTVEIKTYGGADPPAWEYMENDPITIYQDIFLFCDARPLINEEYIAYGYASASGTLYRTDPTNYGAITEINYNGIFQNVVCATWNNFYGMISFVKGSNLLHLTVSDYEISRSQDIHLENPESQTAIPIYDLDMKDTDIYKLQLSILQHDDEGQYSEVTWSTYNYHVDTLLPYSNSVTLYVDNRTLMKQGQAHITAIVRDQFGVGLLGKNVWFTMNGDIAGSLTPVDGYLVSDADGRATIQYDASSGYTGQHEIIATIDGGNNAHGSSYVVAGTTLQQYHQFISPCSLRAITLDPFYVSIMANEEASGSTSLATKVAYVFPGNGAMSNLFDNWTNVQDTTKILWCQRVPTLKNNELLGDNSFTNIRSSKILLNDPDETQYEEQDKQEVMITSQEVIVTEKELSANFISRHIAYGHIDTVVLDQFVFVQDARPAMWSEKNNVDTDFWIRLRPFAASLNPATLSIELKEVSYIGDQGWQDVTDLGVITMFDAGGGILGIDFLYDPIGIFHHNSVVHVHIEVYDTAAVPNLITLEYWFKIIQDYKAPYIVNQQPAVEAYDVPIDTNISFDIVDDGEGVDIDTLEIFVNQRATTFTYDEYEPGNYHVYCTLNTQFHFGQTVSVNIEVLDRSDNENRLLDGWKFYCAESTGPWIDMDNTTPALCLVGRDRKQQVAVQVYGIDDTGVGYDSIKMEVGGRYRNLKITPIVYRLN